MGAIGAVGGVGGGLGDGGSSYDASSAFDEAGADAASQYQSSINSWYDASSSSVMETNGDVDGSTVTLSDADLSQEFIIGKEKEFEPPPMVGGDAPQAPSGVGDSPSSDVIGQVAAVYAANSGDGAGR